MRRGKSSAFPTQSYFGSARRSRSAKHLNDAGYGVRAVQHALWTANEFEAIRSEDRYYAKIKGSARFVDGIDGNAIDNHLVVTGFAAPNKERRHSASLTGGR